MKVFKLKKPFSNDAKKAIALSNALNVVSDDKRKAQLPPVPTTRVKLNVKGNRRGMHMQDNPPDSEEMKRRRAMRRLWNKKMPSLHCSNCQFSAQCPQFKAGFECAFLPFLNSHRVENENDLLFYAKELCGEGVKRAQLMILMERLSGAKPDIDTTEALSHVFQQVMLLHQRMTEKDEATLEVESTDGTIIGRLFGNLDKLLGQTRTQQATDLAAPQHAKELLLEDRKETPAELIVEPKRTGNEELMRELAVFSVKQATPAQKAPIQEEL